MANQFALNDAAAMAISPRLQLAMPASMLQLPVFAGAAEIPVGRSPVGNEPRSRSPKAGDMVVSQGIAQATRQLWAPDVVVGAGAAGPLRSGNLRREERYQDPRQWARYLNQANLDQERETDKLRLELASAVRWMVEPRSPEVADGGRA